MEIGIESEKIIARKKGSDLLTWLIDDLSVIIALFAIRQYNLFHSFHP